MAKEYFKLKHRRWKLQGQYAIDLWEKGRDAWNSEIEKHQDADISFSHQDFTEITKQQVDFSLFKFPKEGNIYFVKTNFVGRNVTFNRANFGNCDIFFNANFGGGSVSFKRATFGTWYSLLSKSRFWR